MALFDFLDTMPDPGSMTAMDTTDFGGDWQLPSTMDPITNDQLLIQQDPGLGSGIGNMDPSFNGGNGGIAGMSSDQLGKLASSMGISPSQLASALGLGSSGGSGGLSSLGQFLSSIGGGLGGLLSKGIDSAALGTYLAQAYQQYRNSDKYAEAAQSAADTANPFGDRSLYKTQLDKTYTDPQGFLNSDPTYNFLMKQGLAGLGQGAASAGNLAFDTQGRPAGSYAKDISDYSQGLASKTLNDQRTQLAGLAGASFNPANAANILMQGNSQKLNSQSTALADIGGALKASNGTAPTYQNTVPGTLPGISDPGMLQPNMGITPQQTGMQPPPDPASLGYNAGGIT